MTYEDLEYKLIDVHGAEKSTMMGSLACDIKGNFLR